ncbi:MAG: hypothetical protein ACQESC_01080 [Nanobdellota archaeon]
MVKNDLVNRILTYSTIALGAFSAYNCSSYKTISGEPTVGVVKYNDDKKVIQTGITFDKYDKQAFLIATEKPTEKKKVHSKYDSIKKIKIEVNRQDWNQIKNRDKNNTTYILTPATIKKIKYK